MNIKHVCVWCVMAVDVVWCGAKNLGGCVCACAFDLEQCVLCVGDLPDDNTATRSMLTYT